MNTADLITSFFNNEMNPEQERQFLISVASSDSMRLGLKSHVMLDRILSDNAYEAHVPDTVRTMIFAEASAILATASTPRNPGSGPALPRGGSFAQGLKGRLLSNLGIGILATTMTAVGFGIGYIAHSELDTEREPASPTVLVPSAPQDQRSVEPAPRPASSVPSYSAPTQAQTAQTRSAGETNASEPVAAELPAATRQAAEHTVVNAPVERSRAAAHPENVRSSAPSTVAPEIRTGSERNLGAPEQRVLNTRAAAAASSRGDSSAAEKEQGTQMAPASVKTRIRKSSDTDKTSEHDQGRP